MNELGRRSEIRCVGGQGASERLVHNTNDQN